MKIRLAKTAGFCMGVRRAVEMVLDIQRQSVPTPIVTYGPLIHNPQTLKLLESKGIGQASDLSEVHGGTVIIRAHGISPQERQELQQRADLVVDATCPRVARVQAIIAKRAQAGDFCVIVGDRDHPEVKGLMGFAAAGAIAIPDQSSAVIALDEIPDNRRICLVAQTTQEPEKFEAISRMVKDRFRDVRSYNTICDSTRKRQHEVAQLAEVVDLVVVVGGRGSGNTARLVKVAEAKGKKTLHVETEEELSPQSLEGIDALGVTAGASTPNWLILSVIDKIKEIDLQRKKGLYPLARKVIDVVIMTYLWAALACGALTTACMALQNMSLAALPVAVSCLFVFSMHLFNRIHDASGAVRFNTPQIAAFYATNRTLLTGLAACSSVLALTLSFFMGIYPFLLVLLMISAGAIYTAELLPPRLFPSLKWRSLKDFPGSKTPLVAAGWAMAAAVVPASRTIDFSLLPSIATAFFFAAGCVFTRTALSDLLDIQGDRIVGRETIPILIGAPRTIKLLNALVVCIICILGVAAWWGWATGLAWWLMGNVLLLGVLVGLYRKGHPVDRLFFEALVDCNFILAGIEALLYRFMYA